MLIFIFGLIYNFTRHNLETENINMMKSIATHPFQLGQPNKPPKELRLPFFTLHLGIKGELISTGGGYYDLSNQRFLEELIEQSTKGIHEIGILEEHNLRYCRVKNPMGTTLVFSDISSEKNTLQGLLRSCLIIGIVSFFVFLAISIFLAKWAIEPVARAWKQQKQFVADASHELKTPLTVIMTNAELLQSPDFTDVERCQFLQSISLMAGQMKHLVEKLLMLAKTDNQEASIPMDTLDLSKLVLTVAISFEGVFMDNGLLLESSVEPNITVYGNQEGLQQVIDILLDNASKYAHPNSTTRITLNHTNRRNCCIQVSNPGSPIASAELENIFQRFYRTDKARSRDGSFGLGLSIAENIVHLHKGKIWAESQNGINSFFVELHLNR